MIYRKGLEKGHILIALGISSVIPLIRGLRIYPIQGITPLIGSYINGLFEREL